MSGSMNKVLLIGNLGGNPEVRSFPNGGKVVSLRLATNESWTDKSSGERKERVEWHSVAIYAEAAQKIAEQYLRKGMAVCVEGQLETRKWQDQAGTDRYSTEIALRPYKGGITLLGAPQTDRDAQDRDAPGPDRGRQQGGDADRVGSTGGGSGNAGRRSLVDDEIPFAPSIL